MTLCAIRIYVTGVGIISPLGSGIEENVNGLESEKSALQPLTLFPSPNSKPLPVGAVTVPLPERLVPRTHSLAAEAASQAMKGHSCPPDAVVIGVSTGGISTTEENLKSGRSDPGLYAWHSVGSVSDYLASETSCRGPVLTISTACSSGLAAIYLALQLLRSGKVKTVLTGGADSLCRLTYYGFQALQAVDPDGCRPLDKNRHGMTVAEGAGMLLLTAALKKPEGAYAEILGGGLSCDAYHPAAPHPQGEGALRAVRAAVEDAGVTAADIDYVMLHGTGTMDNDLAESRAMRAFFGDTVPMASSIKGAVGHSLAAAGAMNSVISVGCLNKGFLPANSRCRQPDPNLGIHPLLHPQQLMVNSILVNAFGFGGNNAALVLARPDFFNTVSKPETPVGFCVFGGGCLTGAGDTAATLETISKGLPCDGIAPESTFCSANRNRRDRRAGRLTNLACYLAAKAGEDAGRETPGSIFMGTGWGAMTETSRFFEKLFDSGERFSSPIDFVGSVHNAPAGKVALDFGAKGPDITTSGGDYSFEQALMAAELAVIDQNDVIVMGADELHPKLSPLIDPLGTSDGGGALYMNRKRKDGFPVVQPIFFQHAEKNPAVMESLIRAIHDSSGSFKNVDAFFAGIPYRYRQAGQVQLQTLLQSGDYHGPVVEYRRFTGEYASASATATVIALKLLQLGEIPGSLSGGRNQFLHNKEILVIGFGRFVTATRIFKC